MSDEDQVNMQMMFMPEHTCPNCHKRQWLVHPNYQRNLFKPDNMSDDAFNKLKAENDAYLQYKKCQFCNGGGQFWSRINFHQGAYQGD